jgi:hypothetical protein
MADKIKKAFRQIFTKPLLLLFLTLLSAFAIRIYKINFPTFSSDEVRIAYRGYTLSAEGRDELGRGFPVIFNSPKDYELPATSYLTAMGIAVLGKNDWGTRMPYVLLGTLIVLFTYLITKRLSGNASLGLITALITAFSPTLIFLSKVPNQTTILLFLYLLLFYFLSNKKRNLLAICMTIIFCLLTSKSSWFTIAPFVGVTEWIFRKKIISKPLVFSLTGSIFAIIAVLGFPQGARSLLENNFNLFQSMTIGNGINALRGESLELGWPLIVGKILFNKFWYPIAGVGFWLSSISPATYFGQFDITGLFSYSRIGAFGKILIIPAFLGLIAILSGKKPVDKRILIYIPLLTFPLRLTFPDINREIVALTIPFMAIVIAYGLIELNVYLKSGVLLLCLLEVLFNVFYLTPEIKNTNSVRPGWVAPIVQDVDNLAKEDSVGVTDGIVDGFYYYYAWDTGYLKETGSIVDKYPYRLRQTDLGRVMILNSDTVFSGCSKNQNMQYVVNKSGYITGVGKKDKVYFDYLGNEVAYLIEGDICPK